MSTKEENNNVTLNYLLYLIIVKFYVNSSLVITGIVYIIMG